MPRKKKQPTEAAVREIRRRTRRKFAPQEKVRIVLDWHEVRGWCMNRNTAAAPLLL